MTRYPRVHPAEYLRRREINYYRTRKPAQSVIPDDSQPEDSACKESQAQDEAIIQNESTFPSIPVDTSHAGSKAIDQGTAQNTSDGSSYGEEDTSPNSVAEAEKKSADGLLEDGSSQNAKGEQNSSDEPPERKPVGLNPWKEILPQLSDEFLEKRGLKRMATTAAASGSQPETICAESSEMTRPSPDTPQRASKGLTRNPWVLMLPFLSEEFLLLLGLELIPGVPRGGVVRRGREVGKDKKPARQKSSRTKAISKSLPSWEATASIPGLDDPYKDLLDYPLVDQGYDPVSRRNDVVPAGTKRRGRKSGSRKKPTATPEIPTEPKRRRRKPGSGRKRAEPVETVPPEGNTPVSIPADGVPSAVSASPDVQEAPKRRGRKPGSKTKPSADAEVPTPSAQPDPPKRRGRKPRQKADATTEVNTPEQAPSIFPGNPPAGLSAAEDGFVGSLPTTAASEPKRRGRKPKSNAGVEDDLTGQRNLEIQTPASEAPATHDNNPNVMPAPKRRGRKPGSERRKTTGSVIPDVSPFGYGTAEGSWSPARYQAPQPSTPQEAAYKQSVLKALQEHRDEEGLGCWGRLAERAKVTEDTIRRVFDSERVPYSIWVKIGRTLGLEPPERPEVAE